MIAIESVKEPYGETDMSVQTSVRRGPIAFLCR